MASAPEITEDVSDRTNTEPPATGLKLVVADSKPEKVPCCIYGRAYGTHEKHLAKMYGAWVEKPADLDHRTQGKIETCPQCEDHYQKAVPEKARQMLSANVAKPRAWGYLALNVCNST